MRRRAGDRQNMHLVAVDEAQPVAVLELDVFHCVSLLLLLLQRRLSVGVKL